MRKMMLSSRPVQVGIFKKVERRERRREEKALIASRLTASIKKELIDRLHSKTYGDIINVPLKEYNEIIEDEKEEELEKEEEQEKELDQQPLEFGKNNFEDFEYVEENSSAFDSSDAWENSDGENLQDDIEDLEIEYEMENDFVPSKLKTSNLLSQKSSALNHKISSFKNKANSKNLLKKNNSILSSSNSTNIIAYENNEE